MLSYYWLTNPWHFVTVDQHLVLPLQSVTILPNRDTSWPLINIPSFPSSPWQYYQTVTLRDYQHPVFPLQSVTILPTRDTSWPLINIPFFPSSPWQYYQTVTFRDYQHPVLPLQTVTILPNCDTSWLSTSRLSPPVRDIVTKPCLLIPPLRNIHYRAMTLHDRWSTSRPSPPVRDNITKPSHFVTINIPSFPSRPWQYYQTVTLRDYQHPDFPLQSVTLLPNRVCLSLHFVKCYEVEGSTDTVW